MHNISFVIKRPKKLCELLSLAKRYCNRYSGGGCVHHTSLEKSRKLHLMPKASNSFTVALLQPGTWFSFKTMKLNLLGANKSSDAQGQTCKLFTPTIHASLNTRVQTTVLLHTHNMLFFWVNFLDKDDKVKVSRSQMDGARAMKSGCLQPIIIRSPALLG